MPKANNNSKSKASSASSSSTTTTPSASSDLADWVGAGFAFYAIYLFCKAAYKIRLGAIDEYGPVIHEFDPYFNFRATEYLYWNGWRRFFSWFDYMVWYPLGRPVGTTIYPGMQFTAVWIKEFLLPEWSLNDVCCYMPAWFGVVATCFTGLITYEVSLPANTYSNVFLWLWDILQGKPAKPFITEKPLAMGLYSPALACGVTAVGFMAIVPAHLMRSMGGGYDNESVAVTAMVVTFYFWIRSLRATDPHSWVFGILAGLAYFYMVASWGGYVFVLNLVGTHAAFLVAAGRFTPKLYWSYSLFYSIGTVLAIQVPVVGWTPLKSLEQLGPAAIFCGYQLLQVCEVIKRRRQLTRTQAWMLRIQVVGVAAVLVVGAAFVLAPSGYFGPISARVRGLFVKHTKTGNPLVDSVAEHQPASSQAYFQYLNHVCTLAPFGYFIVMAQLSESSSFLLVWGAAAYFFSLKMVRLILLTAPIGCICAGIVAGRLVTWCIRQWWEDGDVAANATSSPASETASATEGSSAEADSAADTGANGKAAKDKKKKAKSATSKPRRNNQSKNSPDGLDSLVAMKEAFDSSFATKEGLMAKRLIALLVLGCGYILTTSFVSYCWRLGADLANPTIILKARKRDGEVVKVDDYREAYWWLRDNTPTDSRVMAWWDYGYQISAIANRTTMADGNTWNHEHIALLGKALTTNLDEGYEIARHLADYLLVWSGGGGDDLAKSPHLARIANSVYRDHCPDDPTCRAFGFVDRQGTPSKMMGDSLLYILHGQGIKPGIESPDDKFIEVFRSKYGKVRIYKILGISEESKQWVADPANRECDVAGSWFCPGKYPPGLKQILSTKTDFSQLEDFNRGQGGDAEYQKRYFEDLKDPDSARRKVLEKERMERSKQETKKIGPEAPADKAKMMEEIYNTWADTEDTTLMWRLINTNNIVELKAWLEAEPQKAFVRSKDGRGPMWWSFEQRNEEITKLLMGLGVPHTDKDAKGKSPVDLLEASIR